MEGAIAKLPEILEIARAHDAIVLVDDSHATGVLGKNGRGTAEHFGVVGEVDVITSTLGKALGGAAGGFVAGSAALTDYLTQRSRPQLFSNALPPTVAASALAAVRLIEEHPERVETLRENSRYFREQIIEAGFKPLPGETPIIPIIVGETAAAIQMSDMLLDEGVFVTGFGYPVVPQGQARVRCQISAAHSRDDLDTAIRAFKKGGTTAEDHLTSAESARTTYGDDESLPTGDVVAGDATDLGGVALTVEHPRDEPGIDVGREMANDVATAGVDPHVRLIDARRIRDENELVALFESVDNSRFADRTRCHRPG